MSTQTDSLARAIEYLGAVQVRHEIGQIEDDYSVSVKTGELYAFHDGAAVHVPTLHSGSWYVGSSEDMRSAYLSIGNHGHVPTLVEMPSWWSPRRREVWRVRQPDGSFTYLLNSLSVTVGTHSDAELVTADLDTGEEVSA